MLSNELYANTQIYMGRLPKTREPIIWNYMGGDTVNKCGGACYLAKEGVAVVPFQKLPNGKNANKLRNCYYLNCDLKNWLNGEFIQLYFTKEERANIKKVRIPAIEEIIKWFPNNIERICFPSNEAKENGAAIFCSYEEKEAGIYWLADTGRKPGMSATVVMADGKIYKSAYLAATNVCVRPVIEL